MFAKIEANGYVGDYDHGDVKILGVVAQGLLPEQ
jgi:hypothetical protein